MGGNSAVKCVTDDFDDAFRDLQDIAVPEAKHTKPFTFEPACPLTVVRLLRVLSAIDPDDQPSIEAYEIDDVASDGRLATDAMALELT